MELSQPKPGNETKNIEESSDNFTGNVVSACMENDEMTGLSTVKEELQYENLANKDEEKFYPDAECNSVKCCDSERLENQNLKNATKYFYSDIKKEIMTNCNENGLEQKKTIEIENGLQQQINHQDFSGDSSNASNSDGSSGIEKDLTIVGEITENKDEPDDINVDNIFKEDGGEVSAGNNANIFDAIKFPYKDPSNPFKVVIPLIGKNVMAVQDIKPFNQRYDLAKERNMARGLLDAPFMPKLSYHEWRKQRDARPQAEKDKEERREKFEAIKTAVYIIKISINILKEMKKHNPDEKAIGRWFFRFLELPVSPLSLLLSSQFVHAVMYIRGSSDFGKRLRQIADKCYFKCHVMFPIPEGYNFETVYTSEIIKNIPQQLNGMHDFCLDYGNLENVLSESEDSAFSDSDNKYA